MNTDTDALAEWVLVCRHSEADEFVVSFVSDDGSVKRVATFINYDDARLFVNAKKG